MKEVILALSTWLAFLQGKWMWSGRFPLNEMSKLPWRNQYQFYFVSYYKWPRWSHQIKNGFVVIPDKHRKCPAIIKLSSRLVLLDIFPGIHFCKLWSLHSLGERCDRSRWCQKLSCNFTDWLLVRWEQFCIWISDRVWNSTEYSTDLYFLTVFTWIRPFVAEMWGYFYPLFLWIVTQNLHGIYECVMLAWLNWVEEFVVNSKW